MVLMEGKIADGTITDAELADGSVGTDELQDNSVTDAKIVDVDGSKIINNSIPSGKFEPGAIESADIGQNQITGGPDGNIALNTITDDNIDEISGAVIEDNSIDGDALADGAVGSAQLADDSVLNQHVAAGQISGAAGSKAHIEPNSLGSDDYALNSVDTDALGLGSVTNEILANNSVTNEKVVDATLAPGKIQNTTGPAQFIAGPTGAAGVVTAREIVGEDLPTATDTEKGGVIAGDGLVMDGDVIEIDNDIAASTDFRLVTYNEKGLVTDGLVNNVTGATHSVITYNDSGLVTDGRDLTADDLPEIPIDIIVGEIGDGTGDGPSLGQCAVNGPNICDYATCLIQEANPGRGDFLGQFWYTPSTAQLRVYRPEVQVLKTSGSRWALAHYKPTTCVGLVLMTLILT